MGKRFVWVLSVLALAIWACGTQLQVANEENVRLKAGKIPIVNVDQLRRGVPSATTGAAIDTPVFPTLALISTPAPALSGFLPECLGGATDSQAGQVVNVMDGDSIEVRLEAGHQVYRIDYLGIDAPEEEEGLPGQLAADFNAGLVLGKPVLLVEDAGVASPNGGLLRYVFAGDQFVNYELLMAGYAAVDAGSAAIACAADFWGAEQSAQGLRLGLWGLPTPPGP
jgi:endonuclease YncB( thermonuclease family)